MLRRVRRRRRPIPAVLVRMVVARRIRVRLRRVVRRLVAAVVRVRLREHRGRRRRGRRRRARPARPRRRPAAVGERRRRPRWHRYVLRACNVTRRVGYFTCLMENVTRHSRNIMLRDICEPYTHFSFYFEISSQ